MNLPTSQPPQPALPSQNISRPTITSQRPKLTLQTSALPKTFGNSNTGLSLSFVANTGASPTVRNTFRNAYDFSAPSSATASPSKSSNKPSKLSTSSTVSNNNNAPYQLPLGVRSILRNSPLEPTSRRRSLSIASTAATRRVFFPAKKQVSYRYPLEEEIKTVRFTARHSDIPVESGLKTSAAARTPDEHDEGSDSSSAASSSSSESGTSDEDSSERKPQQKKRKKQRTLSSERQIRAAALVDGLEADNTEPVTPQTPVRGQAKRRREWKWTLGPTSGGRTESQKATTTTTPPPPRPTKTPFQQSTAL
ncbi:hypothetical protein ASPZODRAFT_150354 [Penicilliopsis zonata CBS 506.65]|uniref:Uncharacterized protein n=1 Tax=Penicilliopsis zonata CBS 506.65 TaxID=1073090 RepID=A0A1L9SQW9_9EURO|nr:hypothetical protein ASPZODRAFT_150354 [Penicilliopsis zonata CBS 506.65]OJJ49471.1 hypothetical protein ASPZODRAFT_150354 [Penicilliopsis zonata CBS 506.65]